MNRRLVILLLRRRMLPLLIAGILIASFVFTILGHLGVYLVEKVVDTASDIVIDPGHGGMDPGANDSDGLLEKDITLDVSFRIRDYLIRQGITVTLTREDDRDLSGFDSYRRGRHRRDLTARVHALGEGRAGVSIHVNASSNKNEKGAMVFCKKSDPESRDLAERILAELKKLDALNHDAVIERSLFILDHSPVPVALIEIGFITNPEDKQNLMSEEYRDKIAKAIAMGIAGYIQREA